MRTSGCVVCSNVEILAIADIIIRGPMRKRVKCIRHIKRKVITPIHNFNKEGRNVTLFP